MVGHARLARRFQPTEPLTPMSRSRRGTGVPQARVNLDPEIAAMVDRVRQVFGDEILAAIYDRARNAAIRQAPVPATPEVVPNDGRLSLVSNADDDGFLRALRDELDRALNIIDSVLTEVEREFSWWH